MDFSASSPPLSSGQSDGKRSYEQMQRSHNDDLLEFSATFPSFFPRRPSIPQNTNYLSRHTSSTVDNMAERSRHRASMRASPYQPPRLQHRASQTVIDLTGDSDELPSQSPAPSVASQRRTQRLPRLGRDDILGADEPSELIDLTADVDNQSEADLELIGVHQRRSAIPAANNPPRGSVHSRLLDHLHRHPRGGVDSPHVAGFDFRRPAELSPPRQRPDPVERDFLHSHGSNNSNRAEQSSIARISQSLHSSLHRAMMAAIPPHHQQGILGILSARDAPPDFNMALNYDAVPFGGDVRPRAEPQKTPHVPPKPAKEGFTRTPATLDEDEILICPACEEELVQHPSEKPPPTTNSRGKALSDKERAEHPFWVVRKCGHVFCNKCYQDRKNKNGDCKFYVEGKPKNEKNLICPVEDCSSTVAKSVDWIGMFL